MLNTHAIEDDELNVFKCALCDSVFVERREMQRHIKKVHGPLIGLGDMHEPVYDENEDPFTEFPKPGEMAHLYHLSLPYILRGHDLTNENIHVFSYPVRFKVTSEDIERQVKEIYYHQHSQKSFKLDVSAGVLLFSQEDEKWRYFAPQTNCMVMDFPIIIHNKRTMNAAVDYLQKMPLDDAIRNLRPDTKWKVMAITNLDWYTYNLEYTLGGGASVLPEYVRRNKSIITEIKHRM